jgi:hypothetical protein
VWCIWLRMVGVRLAVRKVMGSGPRPQGKHNHGRPCSSTHRELVVLVQKPQSSTLKLTNSVLQGMIRWKTSARTLVPLAGDMGTMTRIFFSCPEKAASSCELV